MRPPVAQLAADVEAGAVGQHHVEHDEIDLLRRELVLELAAVRGQRDTDALLVEVATEQLADFEVVVDDEDMRGDLHQGNFIARRGLPTRGIAPRKIR